MKSIDQLNNFINYAEMLMPASNYWNVIHGRSPGEVSQDTEGLQIMRVLGRNMAWLMKLVEHGKGVITPPEREPKTYMVWSKCLAVFPYQPHKIIVGGKTGQASPLVEEGRYGGDA